MKKVYASRLMRQTKVYASDGSEVYASDGSGTFGKFHSHLTRKR